MKIYYNENCQTTREWVCGLEESKMLFLEILFKSFKLIPQAI